MRKSRFDNPKFMERRARVLGACAGVIPGISPEHRIEFYAAIERGVARYGITFGRPLPGPAAPKPKGTNAATGRGTLAHSARDFQCKCI